MSNKDVVKQDAERALTPKLRFPEFRDTEGWRSKRLATALKFQAGFPFDSASFAENRKGLRLIRTRDLKSDDKIIFYTNTFGETFVVSNGDVLVGMDGDFTPCVWNKGKALLNQRVGRILPKEGSNQRFLYYFLTAHLKAIEEATARTTVKHLSHSDVEKIHEPLPALPEQQKIAECLTTLDEVIAAQSQKIDALKTHKKGLMQQLFPREGETLPRLRFPVFQNTGEWDEEKLGSLVEIWSGNSPSNYALSTSGAYAFVKVEDLNNCTKYQTHSREYCDDADDVIPRGVVLFPKRGASIELNKIRITASEILIDTNLMALSPAGKLTVEFLYYFLVNVGLAQIADLSTIPQINNKHIVPFKILRPSKLEQQRIATCLTSLDDLITAHSAKLSALKTHKKGLMQQLFPSPEAVEA